MDIVQVISAVGFPIVSFFVAAYGLKYSFDKSNEQNNKALDTVAELTEAVNHNTLVLTELVEKLNKEDV